MVSVLIFISVAAALTANLCSAATPADFYVSPDGSDVWSGTLCDPVAGGNDGPFATLERARDAVRDLKKSKSSDIVVLIREGTYQLDKTVVFGLEDSGAGESTITYAAYPGEKPVFSLGRIITGLEKVTGTLPGLPPAAQGKVWVADVSSRFFTLYDDEGLLPRARSAGFIPLEGSTKNELHCPEGLLKNWVNVEDVEIVVRPFHAWIMNVLQRMGDGNAIYLRGGGSGNVIRRNYVHHLVTPMLMQVAVRTDGGQLDTLIAENLIYKCSSQGIMMKLNTRVENNIVANVIAPPRGYYLCVREGPMTGATIKKNIFYTSDAESVFIHELQPKRKGQFIAERADFICVEKAHAFNVLGASELGAKHEARAFKAINPDIRVLFYCNSAYAWPYTSYNRGFAAEKIEAHPELKKFLLPHVKKNQLAHRSGIYFFDVLNPEFRTWWAETVAQGLEESECDGIFIDQMHGFVGMRRDRVKEIEWSMGDLIYQLKSRMGADQILLANNANGDDAKHVYPLSEAVMFENYAPIRVTKENLLIKWGHMLKNAREGKISVFRMGVEGVTRFTLAKMTPAQIEVEVPEIAREKLEFALACFLIGAQPYSYFMYGWGWTLHDGTLMDYPEWQNSLGAPKGHYHRSFADGWEFTREFEHANVWVNTETREGRVTWK